MGDFFLGSVGGNVDKELNIAQNGTYIAPTGKAYNPIIVSVSNTYSISDEGKVVNNGALTNQINKSINENGTYDITSNNTVIINVPNIYNALDEEKIVNNGILTNQTNRFINENGTYDTTLNNEVMVCITNGSEDKIINRTISGTYTDSTINTIGQHAFAQCINLTSINFPACTSIGTGAF